MLRRHRALIRAMPPTALRAMSSTRLAHRRRLLLDPDVLHAGAIAATACVLSGGLVYLGYVVHVTRVAVRAPCTPQHGRCLLVFGKHSPKGVADADFAARLARAATLWHARIPQRIVLLGGGPSGQPSEAEVARAALLAQGVDANAPLHLEKASRDTLQNLRNARFLLQELGENAHVTLLSSRYHLARCALFARQLGYAWEVCAAESRLPLGPRTLWRLLGEAGYYCLIDIGTRWARLIGHRRMLARVS
jgi:uncharacterized SAM-binding protein YcdF (DUF218 family)